MSTCVTYLTDSDTTKNASITDVRIGAVLSSTGALHLDSLDTLGRCSAAVT